MVLCVYGMWLDAGSSGDMVHELYMYEMDMGVKLKLLLAWATSSPVCPWPSRTDQTLKGCIPLRQMFPAVSFLPDTSTL